MAKLKESEKFKKLNEEIGLYAGLYARWRSSGFKGEPPQDLVDQVVVLDEKINSFLVGYGKDE